MKIGDIREVIETAAYVRRDLTGGTAEEFRKQQVGPRLAEEVTKLRALEIPPRFAEDIKRREDEIKRCEDQIARWQHAQNPEKAPAPPLFSEVQLARVARHWREIAGEPITVELIGGCLYAACSELAAYRLERKYNDRPHCEALYSKPRASWMFRLEPKMGGKPPGEPLPHECVYLKGDSLDGDKCITCGAPRVKQ